MTGQSSSLRAIRDRNFHVLSFPRVSENRVTTSSIGRFVLYHVDHKWFLEFEPFVFPDFIYLLAWCVWRSEERVDLYVILSNQVSDSIHQWVTDYIVNSCPGALGRSCHRHAVVFQVVAHWHVISMEQAKVDQEVPRWAPRPRIPVFGRAIPNERRTPYEERKRAWER